MTDRRSVPVRGVTTHVLVRACCCHGRDAGARRSRSRLQGAGDPQRCAVVFRGRGVRRRGRRACYGDLPGRHEPAHLGRARRQNAIARISDPHRAACPAQRANWPRSTSATRWTSRPARRSCGHRALSRHGHDWRLASSAVAERVSPARQHAAKFAGRRAHRRLRHVPRRVRSRTRRPPWSGFVVAGRAVRAPAACR